MLQARPAAPGGYPRQPEAHLEHGYRGRPDTLRRLPVEPSDNGTIGRITHQRRQYVGIEYNHRIQADTDGCGFGDWLGDSAEVRRLGGFALPFWNLLLQAEVGEARGDARSEALRVSRGAR